VENIIRQLYRENREMLKLRHVKNSRQPYAYSRMERLAEALKLKTPTEFHILLDGYQNAVMELLDAAGEDNYILGYQLGVRMMVAAWPDAENRK